MILDFDKALVLGSSVRDELLLRNEMQDMQQAFDIVLSKKDILQTLPKEVRRLVGSRKAVQTGNMIVAPGQKLATLVLYQTVHEQFTTFEKKKRSSVYAQAIAEYTPTVNREPAACS